MDYIGCASWKSKYLSDFYPADVKDELAYYSTQFNAVELHESYFSLPRPEYFWKLRQGSADDFKFFPKLGQDITHWARLKDTGKAVNQFVKNVSALGDKLGVVFAQLPPAFDPRTRNVEALRKFVENWKYNIPLAIEVRNPAWFTGEIAGEVFALLEENSVANIIIDTAANRDILHMRLTTPTAFVRFVGTGHESDYKRLDAWAGRANEWKGAGLKDLYFFVHLNKGRDLARLARYFISALDSGKAR